jgi:hypothetical protein
MRPAHAARQLSISALCFDGKACLKMLIGLEGAHAFWMSIFSGLGTFGYSLRYPTTGRVASEVHFQLSACHIFDKSTGITPAFSFAH